MKKILWKIKCFFGRKLFITIVEDNLLKSDEILLKGHHIYISKNAVTMITKGGNENENS